MSVLSFGVLVIAVILSQLNDISFSQDCSAFVATTGQPSSESGRYKAKFNVDSLKECIEKCRDYGAECRYVQLNMLDSSSLLECVILDLVNTSSSSGSTTFSNDSVGKLYVERLCLQNYTQTCSTPWSFELVPNTEVSVDKITKFVVKELQFQAKEECLSECLKMDECRSVQIDTNRNRCVFLSLTRHAIRKFDQEEFFVDSPHVQIYENNCQSQIGFSKVNQSDCKFFKRKTNQIPHIYNSFLKYVYDVQECENSCLKAGHVTCRSFTYDSTKRICYLSHLTTTNIQRNSQKKEVSFDFNGPLVYGELDDCIGLGLECTNYGMIVYGKTLKLFNGTFGVRSFDDNNHCGTNVVNRLNFSFKLDFNDCGTRQEDHNVYTNILQLKDSFTTLITYRDREAKVICRVHRGPLDDLVVTVQLHVIADTTGEIILLKNEKPIAVQPAYKLNVLNSNLQPVNVVRLGDYGYLEITFDNVTDDTASVIKMKVSNLIAKDVRNGKELNLLDNNGCPVDPEFVGPFETTTSPGTLRTKIRFSGFSETAKVYYKGDVKPCLGDCNYNCNSKSKPSNRRKRDTNSLTLLDTYQKNIGGGTIESDSVLMKHDALPLLDEKWSEDWNYKPLKLPKLLNLLEKPYGTVFDYDVEERRTESRQLEPSGNNSSDDSTTPCATKSSCIITIFLVAFQGLLFIVCAFVVYFYFKLFQPKLKSTQGRDQIFTIVLSSSDTKDCTAQCRE